MGDFDERNDANNRDPDRVATIDQLNHQANFLNSRNFKQNLVLSQKAYELASADPKYLLGMAAARENSGYANYYLDNYEIAQKHLLESFLIYEEEKDFRGQAACLTELGVIEWRLANYSKAIHYQDEAIQRIEHTDTPQLEQTILLNIGLAYLAMGRFETALETYQLLLDKYDETLSLHFRTAVYNNLTMIHHDAGRFEEAHEWALKSIALAKQNGDHPLLATIQDTLGIVLLAKNAPKEALAYFQKSEQIALESDFKSLQVDALINRGRAYQALEQMPKALSCWKKALVLANRLGLRQQQRQCHQLLSHWFKQQGNVDLALDHFERFHQLDKEISQETAELKIKMMHTAHEVHLTKTQNDLLRQAMVKQKQVEEALRKSVEEHQNLSTLMRLLCDNVPDLIWAKDLKGRYLFVNQAMCDKLLLAKDTAEPLGKDVFFFSERAKRENPNDPNWHTFGEICADSDAITLETQRAQRFDEFGNVQGKLLHLDAYKAPFLNDAGELIGTVGCGRDVTLEKAREREKDQIAEALRQSEKRFRSMVEHMPIMVDAFDEEQNVVFWNKECERVTGYRAEEMVNNPKALSLLYPDPNYRAQIQETWESEKDNYYHRAWEISCKDGSKRTVAWSSISNRFPLEGWANWSIGIDVTDRLRAEAALRYAQKMESLGVLAGGIAHDFNNLLVSILGYMSLATTSLPGRHPALTHVQKAIAASEKAANLTQKMLAYSGRGHFSVEPLSLNQIIQETLPLMQLSLPERNLIHIVLENALPMITADLSQIQQVIRNLILNGMEALPNQSGSVVVTTTAVSLQENEMEPWTRLVGQSIEAGEFVCLEVTDDGIGIEQDDVSKMFDPFFTTKPASHHGLGLAAVLGIIRGHRGGIQVRSTPSRGTAVRVILPTAIVPERIIEPKTAVSQPDQSVSVLVIDDQIGVRETISDIIELDGLTCLQAADGQEGVDLVHQHGSSIHLVILDLSMPGLSGEETFWRLREIAPDVPVLFSSGYDQTKIKKTIPNEPNVSFIQKPYRLKTFLEAVNHLLGREPTFG